MCIVSVFLEQGLASFLMRAKGFLVTRCSYTLERARWRIQNFSSWSQTPFLLWSQMSGSQMSWSQKGGHKRPGHKRPGHKRPGHKRLGHKRPAT